MGVTDLQDWCQPCQQFSHLISGQQDRLQPHKPSSQDEVFPHQCLSGAQRHHLLLDRSPWCTRVGTLQEGAHPLGPRGDGQEYPQEMTDPEYRPKRRSYGSKYDDNKAYGFWISALNKAGNYKRGKRSTPFVPAMSALDNDRNPFQGHSDYSDMVEQVPDHPMDKDMQQ